MKRIQDQGSGLKQPLLAGVRTRPAISRFRHSAKCSEARPFEGARHPYIPLRIPSRHRPGYLRDTPPRYPRTYSRVDTPHDESRHGLANARPLL